MIIAITDDDISLASTAQQKLAGLIPKLSRTEVIVAETALAQLLTEMEDNSVLFVVGADFDRLAETIERLRHATKREIVAMSLAGDSKRILKLIRSGASDYVDLAMPSDGELASIVDRLHERSSKGRTRGKIIGVTSASGGCGASTLSVNLSWALAEKSNAVCLIDLDPCGGGLATLLNLHPTHTLADLCALNRKIDASALDGAVVRARPNLSLLAAPVLFGDASGYSASVVEQILDIARSQHSHIVLDLGDAAMRDRQPQLLDCDLLVVAMRLEFPCILRTREHLRCLQEQGMESSRILLVANRCLRRDPLPRKKVMEALGMEISGYVPEETELLQTAINVGSPALSESPHSKYAKAIRELVACMSA